MDPLSILASVAGLATAAYQIIGYVGDVKTGGKERVAIGVEISHLWAALTSLSEQLSPDALKEDNIPSSLRPILEPDGILRDIDTLLTELANKLKARKGKLVQALAWPFTQKDALQTVQRIQRLNSTLNDAINQSTYAVAQDTYRAQQSVKKTIDEGRVKELIEWISPLNFVAKQSMIWNEHHKGTCTWFLDRDDFREWREGENTKLFCPGIPGAGKTFLSSIVYNELEGMRVRGEGGVEDAAVIMLYCKWDDPLSQDIDNLLSSIIKQFVQRYGVGVDEMMELYKTHSKEGTRPSREQLQATLNLLISRFPKVFIMLDGLDELKDEKERLPLLKMLSPYGPGIKATVNLMVTSRPLPVIVRHFRPSNGTIWCDVDDKQDLPSQYHCAECVESYDLCDSCYDAGHRCGHRGHFYYYQFNAQVIPIAAVQEDLSTYVQWRVGASDFLQQYVDLKDGLMDKILERVVHDNGGMFLLAKFNMDTLESQMNIKQVLAALKVLPQELDGTYTDAMLRITQLHPMARESVMYFLRWVVFAEQPLHEREIEHALAVADGDTDIDNDNITSARRLANKCAGLVQFDESDCIRLVHFSAEDFFKQHHERWFPEGSSQMTSICLTYLQFDVFGAGACSGPSEAADFDMRLEKYPFLRYASVNWGKHLQASLDDSLFNKAVQLVTHAHCLATATQALWYLEDQHSLSSWSAKDGSGIHLAAHFNLNRLVQDLIHRGYDPDTRDINGATPLALAALRGHVDVVATLINAGCSVNTVDNSGRSALHRAMIGECPEVVQLLLAQKDIDVNIADYSWSNLTPLMITAMYGYVEFARLLVDRPDIDINKECLYPDGATALVLAARAGMTDVANILLTHPDVDINHQVREGSTALTWAAQEGYYQVVEALLDKGADTELLQSGSNGTAIMRAIDANHVAVVQLLANRGANLHHKDVFDRGLLHSAAVNRRWRILEILLAHDKTLDVNMQDANGKTTLHDIARMGDRKTTELLLAHGGDPTIKDNHGRTPIRVARESNSPALVEMFRVARARQKEQGITSQPQRTSTGTLIPDVKRTDTAMSVPEALPLWSLAISRRVEELKERLPDASPEEVNEQDPDMGQAALHWAITDNLEIAKLLIAHGADINLQNNYGRTPLHCAVLENNWKAGTLIIDAGADLNIRDQWGARPVAMAGSIGVLLIDRGANIDDISANYYLPLAARIGLETAVRRLIAAGADIWTKDADGKSPYMIAKENQHHELANLMIQLAPRPVSTPNLAVASEANKKTNGPTNGSPKPDDITVEEVIISETEKPSTVVEPTPTQSPAKEPILKTAPTTNAATPLFTRHMYTILILLILIAATSMKLF
ncbi:ankyrin repeat-containing domain protein [Aspergillus californicus]